MVITENIEIPAKKDSKDINLQGSIYYSEKTPEKASFVVNMAGLLDHRESYFVKLYTEKFANRGYYVLSYDYRAHGTTAKQTGRRWDKMIIDIFKDLNLVINWIKNNQTKRLDNSKLLLFGRSLGGAINLSQGYINKNVKAIIALCTRFDYHTTHVKFPEEIVKFISPMHYLKVDPSNQKRVLIAHCRDDKRIPFKNLIQIEDALGLPAENVLEYESGGHSFKGHRDDIFLESIKFIEKNI